MSGILFFKNFILICFTGTVQHLKFYGIMWTTEICNRIKLSWSVLYVIVGSLCVHARGMYMHFHACICVLYLWAGFVNNTKVHLWLKFYHTMCRHRFLRLTLFMTSRCLRYNTCSLSYIARIRLQILGEPVIVDIANKCQKTPAQVVLRWALQLGIGNNFLFFIFCVFCRCAASWFVRPPDDFAAVIPKSTKAERIEENSKLFDFSLSEDQIASISGLNQNKHYCWDPTAIVWRTCSAESAVL